MPFCVVTGDDSSHSQGQSGKRLLLASRGHPARTALYHGSCIDPTHLSHTLDPTPDDPFPITQLAIRLLIKDMLCGAVPLIWIFWLMSWIVMLLPNLLLAFIFS